MMGHQPYIDGALSNPPMPAPLEHLGGTCYLVLGPHDAATCPYLPRGILGSRGRRFSAFGPPDCRGEGQS